jgi:membrane carboxypeptidase/penicillin-binding protein PbpC
MITNTLSDNKSRLPEFFDCNQLQLYANSQNDCWAGNRGAVRPAAAKTGTTTDFRDNWTVGYTTDFVMGVWAGNDNNAPMIDVTGVQGAAPIWHEAMLVAEARRPIRDFANPGGLERATVTYPDGVRTTDWFLPGTVPSFTQFNNDGFTQPVVDQTPTPKNTKGNNRRSAAPYCPGNFTFVFAPPSNNGRSANSSWW